MAQGFEIEVKGLNELIKTAEQYPAISEKHINKAINRSLIRIQNEVKRRAPAGDTQQLRQNWVITMARFEGKLESGAKRNGYQYGLAIEDGTVPHYVPVKTNQPFQIWAQRRGLNPYAVSRSIAKKGTKAKPFFQPAIDSQKNKIDDEFGTALENIINEI